MRPNATNLPIILSPFIAMVAVGLARAATPSERHAASAAIQALPAAAIPPPEIIRPDEPAEQEPSVDDVVAIDIPDAPVIAQEIEQESAELEDLRKAEEASQVRDSPRGRRAGASGEGLGLESPFRDRVGGAVGRDGHSAGEKGGRIALLPELDHDLATLQAEYDIPIDVNEAVVAYVRFFQSPAARGHFVKWLGRSHRYLDKYRAILREEGLPEDTVYLAMIESGFGNFAYSRAKASGPWQFIAATGKTFGLKQDFWVDQRRDPVRSARAAARFLKQLYKQTGDWRLAWAGYNAGPGRILAARRMGHDDFWSMAAAPGKRVLHPETKGYVPKLMAAAIISKHPEAFGFQAEEIEKQSWIEYAEVEVPSATLLSVLARAAGIGERELIELNPDLRRSCTPPRPYKLKIPVASSETFAVNWPAMREKAQMTFAGHVIRKGDTLSRIALRYGVPVQGIMEMNNLRHTGKLRVGQELLIPRPVGSVAAARSPEPVARRAVKTVASAKRPDAARSKRTTLKVRSGDTLWSISQRFGVGLHDLCRWNGIKNPGRHKLLAGTRLIVYPERG
jgi:membrane-bound lytic murein transglycosylase D